MIDKYLTDQHTEAESAKKRASNFVLVRNFTTNQPVEFHKYENVYCSMEVLRPLHNLPSEIKQLCEINSEAREAWVQEIVEDFSRTIGKQITFIEDEEIEDRTKGGEVFDMYLPTGEFTALHRGNLRILEGKPFDSSCDPKTIPRTFKDFHSGWYAAARDFDYFSGFAPKSDKEYECLKRLQDFISGPAFSYEVARTKIDPIGTSHLSAYFSMGIMPFEHIIEQIHKAMHPTTSHKEFERQAHWILYCKIKAKEKIDRNLPMPLRESDKERFLAWANGCLQENDQVDWMMNTQMRRLKEGKLVSNRFRLMACFYLAKVLNIDWRYGEYYFRSALKDSHPLVNYYNWMWQCCGNRFFNGYNLKRQLSMYGM